MLEMMNDDEDEESRRRSMAAAMVICGFALVGLWTVIRKIFGVCCRRPPEQSQPLEIQVKVQTEEVQSETMMVAKGVQVGGSSSSSAAWLLPRAGLAHTAFRAGTRTTLRCYCGLVLQVRVTMSEPNRGRMYVSCPKHCSDPSRCSFFKWMDSC